MTYKPTPTDVDLWEIHVALTGHDKDPIEFARAVLAKWGQPAQAAGNVPAISDLPPLPDPDLRDVGTKPQDVKDFLNGYATEYARLALAARAPAGSVQEDAETALRKVLGVVQRYLPPDGPSAHDSLSEIIEIVDPWPLGPLEKP